MDRNVDVSQPLIVGLDEDNQVRIRASIQSEGRVLDVRLWRRGATGFSPTRTGLTVGPTDHRALVAGIAELNEASDSGRRVARVVWDSEDGRRLRGETEPFGTRFLAKLGFWQLARDTWRPADDGLVLAADRLAPLRNALQHLEPWISHQDSSPVQSGVAKNETPWPAPGADWLTVESDRLAFHPRGVRLTFSLAEHDGRHWITVRQWRRDDTLWLPESLSVSLSLPDLNALLACLRALSAGSNSSSAEEAIACSDGSTLRVRIETAGGETLLHIEGRLPARAGMTLGFERRFVFPAAYLTRFGRALAQSRSLLAGKLSPDERANVESERNPESERGSRPSPQQSSVQVSPRGAGRPPRSELDASGEIDPMRPKVFAFGAESETPGMVIPEQTGIRIVVEGFLLPRSITLPVQVATITLAGLENLSKLRRGQGRIDPTLLCDRPECAVYGRVGTAMRPDAVELRVWTGTTTSESVSFEAAYLDDLIDGLRKSLQFLGENVPVSAAQQQVLAVPPAPLPQPSSPARVRPIAPAAPLEGPGRAYTTGHVSPPGETISVPLGGITLGHHQAHLQLQGHRSHPVLSIRWEGNAIDFPVNHLEEMLSDLRALYYDALRGRRGRTLAFGDYPVVTIGVHNQGTQLFAVFQQEIDGEPTTLAFPASEVPAFLNVARAAITRN